MLVLRCPDTTQEILHDGLWPAPIKVRMATSLDAFTSAFDANRRGSNSRPIAIFAASLKDIARLAKRSSMSASTTY